MSIYFLIKLIYSDISFTKFSIIFDQRWWFGLTMFKPLWITGVEKIFISLNFWWIFKCDSSILPILVFFCYKIAQITISFEKLIHGVKNIIKNFYHLTFKMFAESFIYDFSLFSNKTLIKTIGIRIWMIKN